MVRVDWNNVIQKVSKNILLMFLGVLVFMSFLYCIDSNTNPIILFRNLYATSVFKSEAFMHVDDNISVSISTLCEDEPIELQAQCVVRQVSTFYNYSMHYGSINTPDVYVLKGGVCRDSSILYHTIFKRLGWYTTYNFEVPDHVYITIVKNLDKDSSVRCIVDGLGYDCTRIGG